MAKTFRHIKQEVDVHTVVIEVPVRYGDEDIPLDAPGRTGDAWRAVVIADSGQIVGWPGGALDLYMKVVDEGVYTLRDGEGKELGKVDQDYVPHGVVPGEDGDYVKLDIDETGRIKNWPKSKDLDFEAFGLGGHDK